MWEQQTHDAEQDSYAKQSRDFATATCASSARMSRAVAEQSVTLPVDERAKRIETLRSYLGNPESTLLGHHGPGERFLKTYPYRYNLWLTDNPSAIFQREGKPIQRGYHAIPGDSLLQILMSGDMIRPGYTILRQDTRSNLQNRLGPRLGVREMLMEWCPNSFHDKSSAVWLFPPEMSQSQQDPIRVQRELLTEGRHTRAAQECESLAQALILIGTDQLPHDHEIWANMPHLMHRATGNMLDFLTTPILHMRALTAEGLDATERFVGYHLIEQMGLRMLRFIKGYEQKPQLSSAQDLPDNLGIAIVEVDINGVQKRVLNESGLYPVIPSDRSPSKLVSAPNILLSEFVSIRCDPPLYSFLISDDPRALQAQEILKRYNIKLESIPEEDTASAPEIDIISPSCAPNYIDDALAETRAQWLQAARQGHIAPALDFSTTSGLNVYKYITNVFGVTFLSCVVDSGLPGVIPQIERLIDMNAQSS